MIKTVQSYSDYINYAMLFVVSFLFIAIFSTVATPFTIDYSADSSIFMAMGKMFLDGKVPYVDFFDHKGPSLILIQAIGQLFLSYRPGIFIVEVINLFLVLLLVYKTGRLLLNRKPAMALCFYLLFFLSCFFNRGNTTEEFSLIPLFATLYYACKVYFGKLKISPKIAFIIGLSFSFLFWLRVNNSGAIVACCIFLFVWTIANKDHKSLKNLILYFLLGQIPFSLIYLLYFALNGGVYEMIYATFLFNFLYVESLFNFSSAHTWVNYLAALGLAVGSVLNYIRQRNCFIFLFSLLLFILAIVTTNIGPAYNHYFILAAPAIVFSLLLTFDFFENKYFQFAILSFGILLLLNIFYKGYSYQRSVAPQEEAAYRDSYNTFNALIDMIPEEERSRVYCYEVVSSVYPLMGMDANYKYFVFQEWHGKIDPDIYKQIGIIMNEEKPLWVVTQPRVEAYLSKFENRDFVDALEKDYQLYFTSGSYLLYKRN